MSINTFKLSEKIEWAQKCANKLNKNDVFDFYAGKNYYQELSKLLPNSNNILIGLGIGQRLRFLNK
jgi:hypothetical protein